MTKSGQYDVYGKLMLDDRDITFAYTSNYLPGGSGNWMNLDARNSAIIECSEGQQVYVLSANWGEGNAKTTRGDFIGMLIKQA